MGDYFAAMHGDHGYFDSTNPYAEGNKKAALVASGAYVTALALVAIGRYRHSSALKALGTAVFLGTLSLWIGRARWIHHQQSASCSDPVKPPASAETTPTGRHPVKLPPSADPTIPSIPTFKAPSYEEIKRKYPAIFAGPEKDLNEELIDELLGEIGEQSKAAWDSFQRASEKVTDEVQYLTTVEEYPPSGEGEWSSECDDDEKRTLNVVEAWRQIDIKEATTTIMGMISLQSDLTLLYLEMVANDASSEIGKLIDEHTTKEEAISKFLTTGADKLYETLFQVGKVYHMTRGFLYLRTESSLSRQDFLPLTIVQGSHASPFYEARTIQNQWREWYNTWCERMKPLVPYLQREETELAEDFQNWCRPDDAIGSFVPQPFRESPSEPEPPCELHPRRDSPLKNGRRDSFDDQNACD